MGVGRARSAVTTAPYDPDGNEVECIAPMPEGG
jgi:hypothetical protein